jgi:hypothetical protein
LSDSSKGESRRPWFNAHVDSQYAGTTPNHWVVSIEYDQQLGWLCRKSISALKIIPCFSSSVFPKIPRLIIIFSRKWWFPKIGVSPVIIHFSRIFHELNHPASLGPLGYPHFRKPSHISPAKRICINQDSWEFKWFNQWKPVIWSDEYQYIQQAAGMCQNPRHQESQMCVRIFGPISLWRMTWTWILPISTFPIGYVIIQYIILISYGAKYLYHRMFFVSKIFVVLPLRWITSTPGISAKMKHWPHPRRCVQTDGTDITWEGNERGSGSDVNPYPSWGWRLGLQRLDSIERQFAEARSAWNWETHIISLFIIQENGKRS